MGSLVLRPGSSRHGFPWFVPAYLSAPVIRARPVGSYTLNRQLVWEAPFILLDDEHLGSACGRVMFRFGVGLQGQCSVLRSSCWASWLRSEVA